MYEIKESFTYDDLSQQDKEALYNEFKASYEKETGKAWEAGKFLSRARNWTFYGSSLGGIAVRKQRSGMIKFVAAFGNPLTVARGLKELTTTEANSAIWGAMSEKLCEMLEKFTHNDFKRPPAFFVKLLIPRIKNVFGDVVKEVKKDGAIVIEMDGIGTVEKYFIANKGYYRFMLEKGLDQIDLPAPIKKVLMGGLKLLIGGGKVTDKDMKALPAN